jgi:hypothetical protein
VPASEAYEHSELLAYKAQVLAEGGQAEAALALLDAQAVSGCAREGSVVVVCRMAGRRGLVGDGSAVQRNRSTRVSLSSCCWCCCCCCC